MAENQRKSNGLAKPLDIAARTLTGDLRDKMLELVRDLREPFHRIGEKQQTIYADRIDHICQYLVARTVRLVAGHDFPVISAALKQANIKDDDIEAKVIVGRHDDNRHDLFDAQGSRVLVVLADPEAFHGARAAALIDSDEPGLPLDVPPFVPIEEAPGPRVREVISGLRGRFKFPEGGGVQRFATEAELADDDAPTVVKVEDMPEMPPDPVPARRGRRHMAEARP